MRTNYFGYSAKPDGTCIVTDVLPAGTAYVSAYKYSGDGSMEVLSVVENEDGTTTVTVKLSGLTHYEVSKNHLDDRNGSVEFHFIIKTRITDEDYLYGTESKNFTFTNTASLNDRYGNDKSSTASASIYHSAMKKSMVYNEATAPYAQFSIEVNKDKADLNPSGDTVGIVDVSSDTLAVDPNSINVVSATTGDPVPFEIDASGMAENRLLVRVPDEQYVKITYNAQVLGMTGKQATVSNVAYFEGYGPATHGESTITDTVEVLKASGQAVSEPMVWLAKRDESARPLAGASFDLYAYSAEDGWTLVREGIASNGSATSKGSKVESLELGVLYKLVEHSAPEGYVLDDAPHYFVLYGDEEVAPAMPDGLDADAVFTGPSGSVITAYNVPYTEVSFEKRSEDGVRLGNAQLEVRTQTGTVARDADGAPVRLTTSADAPTSVVLAPGTYVLHEVKAPRGYERADDVTFTVVGDKDRTVMQEGVATATVTMVDASSVTSLEVRKVWHDLNDAEGARPHEVTVQLYADGEAVEGETLTVREAGPDGAVGTDDDWTASFEGLPVMRGGTRAMYSVREVDVAAGYTPQYAEEAGAVTITNVRAFDPIELTVRKQWNDEDNARGIRPDAIVVHLLNAHGAEVATATLRASGPDGVPGTDDDWTYTFEELPRVEDDELAVYTVQEDVPNGYRLAGVPERTEEGLLITNELAPEEPVQPGDEPADPARTPRADDGDLPGTGDAQPYVAVAVCGALLIVLGAVLARKRHR